MKATLNSFSRILVGMASLLLLFMYFVPLWRIDLFAPQYPEGLYMNIWLRGLSGDIDIINGLNHYIGMNHISESMFPEFSYLPYVIAILIAFGLLASITGNKNILIAYVATLLLGSLLALYDFYKWGYNYGHNLDPKAAIQVPGLSYQPPVIGYKRLLNFEAYSLPDYGGWIFVAVILLCFIALIIDILKKRKKNRNTFSNANSAVLLVFIALFTISCNVKPEPFQVGKDACSFCRMTIMDVKFGGELITRKGKIYKFDDIKCLAEFFNKEKNHSTFSLIIAANYDKANNFVDVSKAVFANSNKLNSPMGSNIAAFTNEETAIKHAGPGNKLLSWDSIKLH